MRWLLSDGPVASEGDQLLWDGSSPQAPATVDTFTSGAITALGSYTGELGAWTLESGNNAGLSVDAGRVRGSNSAAGIYSVRGVTIGANNHWAEITITRGSATNISGGPMPACRVGANNAYYARHNANGNSFELFKSLNGTVTSLGVATNSGFSFDATGATCVLRCTAFDNTITLSVNGTIAVAAIDTALTSGYVGLRGGGNQALGVGTEGDNYTFGNASQAGR